MAKLVYLYRCPGCNGQWETEAEAIACRNKHPIEKELWAFGKRGKGCLVAYHGEERALVEADLSDYIDVRKKQLEELMQKDPEKMKRVGYIINSFKKENLYDEIQDDTADS